MSLGRGSYGEVVARDGKAIKSFSKLSHLIQEFMALRYLEDCSYVVQLKGVEFDKKQLHMELYDCSLKNWLDKNRLSDSLTSRDIFIIIHDILRGLVELHDKNLVHGDLKPGNILVKESPLRAVLGDCGFVSVADYAKVERTAAVYRDKIIHHHWTHDMFSLGICLLELLGGIKISRQASYSELKHIVKKEIKDRSNQKIIYNLLHEDRSKRPTARYLLQRMFDLIPPRLPSKNVPILLTPGFINRPEVLQIRSIMKKAARKYSIGRCKKGFGAVIRYLCFQKIPVSQYDLYVSVTLVILSSIIGKSGFTELVAMDFCGNRYDLPEIYSVLSDLLYDDDFVNIMLASS